MLRLIRLNWESTYTRFQNVSSGPLCDFSHLGMKHWSFRDIVVKCMTPFPPAITFPYKCSDQMLPLLWVWFSTLFLSIHNYGPKNSCSYLLRFLWTHLYIIELVLDAYFTCDICDTFPYIFFFTNDASF